jgi:hypothetical protein
MAVTQTVPTPTPTPTRTTAPRSTTTTTTVTNPKPTTAVYTKATSLPSKPFSYTSPSMSSVASTGSGVQIPGNALVDDVASPSKSPLLLIAAGLAALWIMERKKGRR